MSACIWYVSKYVAIPSSGDPASRGVGFAREFGRLGHRAVIVTSAASGRYDGPRHRGAFGISEVQGVTLCRVRTMGYRRSKSLRRIMSWIDFELKLLFLPKALLPRPDAVIVSSLSLLTIINGFRLRQRYKCRLVFEVRDIWPLTLVANGGFNPRNPLILLLGAVEKLGYRHADAIVGTMPNLAAHVRSVTGRDLKVHCVPHGCDPEEASSSETPTADLALRERPDEEFLVAYAGTVGFSNALAVLFECAEMMQHDPRIRFLILGDGGLLESYKSRYERLPNLEFVPRVPRSGVNSILARSDVLYLSVLDSVVYEYGISLNKIIDYMVAGKPIIASYSGYRSMIDEAECGVFVEAGNPEALRHEIERFASMPACERKAIGQRGRDWVIRNRNFRVLAESYLRILLPEERSAGSEGFE
jgi:glycosyltransferase involved in cell wall biosynthesis